MNKRTWLFGLCSLFIYKSSHVECVIGMYMKDII
jgi:hypothetical protein